jgi:glycosyltransferase involved in cell wall biosynthesis
VNDELELSVVMPCLNEADTVGTCVEKALRAIREHGLAAEVIVADNGSTDGSREIASALGARVVPIPIRGYGAALMGGIEAARGRYVLMGDSDDSYDFLEIPRYVEKLREGAELVQGCRLPAGGGTIMPGAMPFSHRWLGNPVLSAMVRWMFAAPVDDVYCGMRAFTRPLYHELDLRCTGMEFATEMIVKASLNKRRIVQIPITLHKDGRKAHPPHLNTWRDGWRTVRFFLMYSPRWLFVLPGLLAIGAGLLGYALAMPQLTLMGATLDAHTLLIASLAILLGYQSLLFGLFTKTFAVSEGLLPADARLTRFLSEANLERGLALGFLALAFGAALLLGAVDQWRVAQFGRLDYAHTMRWVIPGVLLTSLGVQTMLSSFFLSILLLRRKR